MTAREPDPFVDEPECGEPFGAHDSCRGLAIFANVRGAHECHLHANHAGSHECGDCDAHDDRCDCPDCYTAAGNAQDEAARETWGDLAQRRA